MKVDIYLSGVWQTCADLALQDDAKTSRYGAVTLRYSGKYAPKNLFARDIRALSARLPVTMDIRAFPRWPSFLIDLLPQGAAKKRVEREHQSGLSEWELLNRGALNPVGNLRIRPPGTLEPRPHAGFELSDMLERGDEFITYAVVVGATVSGSTDAQGEAPKFWVVEDLDGRWHPDAGQLGTNARRFALLKFPITEAGPRASDMLRTEAAYQRVARTLGLRVTAELPTFIGGALLIPRFDRRVGPSGLIRLGVESIYSVAGVIDSAREPLRHHQVLIELSKYLTDFDADMLEYFRRDVLNIAMGNRDNHGRNTAILKETDGSMRLAPLFDFGPAHIDARNIARVIHWDAEQGTVVDWTRALVNLMTRFADAGLAAPNLTPVADALRAFGRTLENLPSIMAQSGVDENIIDSRRADITRLCRSLAEADAP